MYTMKDWKHDGSLNIRLGDTVEDAVVNRLIDCVPSAYFADGIFQVGEPDDSDLETFRNLYLTFTHDCSGWTFRGKCLLGDTEHRKGFGENAREKSNLRKTA